MKYKPGDKVKIRADLRPGEDYGGLKPVLSMCMKRGNIATIKSSEVYNCMLLYHIEGDGCDFLWTEEMFEEIADKEKAGAAMKYKVGDKVLVRNDLEYDKYYSDVRFDKDMEKYRGGQATITEVYEKYKTYRIDLDRERFMWSDDMFEGLVYVLPTPATKAMKYKVGDKVRVRKDLSADDYYGGVFCNSEMARKAGKVVTIKHKTPFGRYKIEEDCWDWRSEMFEGIAEEPTTNDPVSHPSHYTDGKIEVIDFIQDKKLDFARGNVVKYIARAGKKDKSKELEDLKKARQYCDFAIRELEQKTEK